MPAIVSPYCTVWRWPGSCLPPPGRADGLPAAYLRGGHFGRGKDCGVFALSLWLGPSMPAAAGARCCVNNGRTGP